MDAVLSRQSADRSQRWTATSRALFVCLVHWSNLGTVRTKQASVTILIAELATILMRAGRPWAKHSVAGRSLAPRPQQRTRGRLPVHVLAVARTKPRVDRDPCWIADAQHECTGRRDASWPCTEVRCVRPFALTPRVLRLVMDLHPSTTKMVQSLAVRPRLECWCT